MSIRENLAIILFGISAIGLILGIILNMRYRNPYVLRDATDKDKWRWARNVSFFHTILIAGLTTIYLLNIFEQSNIITMVFIIILIFGLTFVPIVFWTKWDMERINNRNINYSNKINDPTNQDKSKRMKQYGFLKAHFPIPEHYARFRAFGFVDNDMIEKDEE